MNTSTNASSSSTAAAAALLHVQQQQHHHQQQQIHTANQTKQATHLGGAVPPQQQPQQKMFTAAQQSTATPLSQSSTTQLSTQQLVSHATQLLSSKSTTIPQPPPSQQQQRNNGLANQGTAVQSNNTAVSLLQSNGHEIDPQNEQFSNVKRHMTQIQRLVTEHANGHGSTCKFVKDFALYKSIWELNRLSKKNPHVSLMKKMLQELPESDWPTPEVKGYVEGSIKKSEMPNTQIYLLNELLAQFYDCYKSALLSSEYFLDDSDLHLSNEEFTKIMVTSFAIRNRQPQTQAKLQRKLESEILKNELLKKFKTDYDFP
jgi:hypothetical protein